MEPESGSLDGGQGLGLGDDEVVHDAELELFYPFLASHTPPRTIGQDVFVAAGSVLAR